VEFRILGPVEARRSGGQLQLGRPQQRLVLAVLLAEAGRTVSTATLIDRMWPSAPDAARRTVQVHIARLRRLLEPAAVPLVGRSGGYLLDVDPDRVDLHRFRRLADAAREPHQPADRAPLLREAVGLWRGEPLAGLPGPWVPRTRSAWRQEYLDAVVAWADAEIAAADPGTVLGPLSALADEHPLTESLVAALMRVLYAAGRGAEALDLYARTRRLLADQLGADPGPDLQRQHLALLRGDRPAAADAPRAHARPSELPTDVRGFAGRTRELAELDAVLAGEGAPGPVVISAVSGTAGVGKSALALHWAHRVRHRFPDGQLYVNLRGFDPSGAVLDPGDALRAFLGSLGVPVESVPSGLPAQTALYRTQLAGRRMLVVLDNARDAEQVRPLLPGAHGCLVLVTSRDQLTGLVCAEGARPMRVDLLSREEARHLLAHRLGEPRVTAEPGPADRIIERSAGLPLALAIVAARAAANPTFSLADLAAQLDHGAGSLDGFASTDAATDLRKVFSWSYAALEPAAARLFRLLALHAGPDISEAAAAGLAGIPIRQARPLLAALCDSQLLIEHRPARYVRHDLLQAYAAELVAADDDRDRAAAVTRVLGFYLATAWHTTPLLAPGDRRMRLADERWRDSGLRPTDEAAALAWLDAERDNLVAAVRQAAGFPGVPEKIAPQLAHALFAFYSMRPHWADWAGVNRVALDTAARIGDRSAVAQAAYDLGVVSWLRGGFEEARAYHDQSVAIWRELGDRGGEAVSLAGQADVDRVLGVAERAIARYEQSLAICRELGDLRGQTMSLGSLGVLYQRCGRSAEALDCLRESLAIRDKLGDRRGQATSLSNLGGHYRREARYEEARAYYEQSLTMRREQGDRHGEGTSLAGLGTTHRDAGSVAPGLRYQQESVAIFRELSDDECLADGLRGLAATLRLLGRDAEADECEQEAAEISERLGTPGGDPAAPAG
jgi:DNA-binding SARP family transcriptional activator/tetratricopeptide (TPR) repeat protein